VAVETLADAAIVIHPDFTKAEAEAKEGAKRVGESAGKATADTFFDKFGRSFESGKAKLSGSIQTFAAVVTAGFGVAGVVKFGLQAAASLQQAQVGFTTLLGSATKAGNYLKQLQAFAAATPFELNGLIDSSRTLLGVGVSAQKVIPMLRAFGDAAGAVGVGQEAFQRIILATSQSISSGRFQLADLNQLMNNGLPIYNLLSQALGKPVKTIRDMATQGKLLTAEVLPKLQKQMEKDYGGAMAKQGQTLAGVWSTLKDTISIGLSNSLTPLIPLFSDLVPRAANVLVNVFKVVSTYIAAFAEGITKGEVKVSGFAGVLQGVGARIGGFISAFTGSGEKVGELGEPFAKLGEEIRNEVIPAHIEFAKDLITEVGPAVVHLVTAIATGLIPRIYVLEEAIKSRIVPAVAKLTEFFEKHNVAVRNTIIVLGGLIAANKAVETVTKVTEFATTSWATALKLTEGVVKISTVAYKSAAAALKGYALVFNLSETTLGTWIGVKAIELKEFLAEAIAAEESTVAIIAHTVASKAAAAATAVWTVIQEGFNAVMDAAGGPIGLAILAIAALVAGIIYAYKHSETFRDIVNGVWKAIKVAIADTVNWIVHTVWPSLIKAWDGIASAALWLWHNAIQPAWHGIEAAIHGVVVAAQATWHALTVAWDAIAKAATVLYSVFLQPIFHAIARVIQAEMAIAQLALKLFEVFIVGPIVAGIKLLYNDVVKPVFGAIAAWVKLNIDVAMKVLGVLHDFLVTVFSAAFNYVKAVVLTDWAIIRDFISGAVRVVKAVIGDVVDLFTKRMPNALVSLSNATGIHWGAIGRSIKNAWSDVKSKALDPLVGFVKNTIPNAFSSAVKSVEKFWGGVKDVVKAPITFTVNHIINPLINGFDKVAKTFGTSQIPPISGFAEGGRIPGAPSSTDNRWSWLRDKNGNVLGKAGLATGEFVVNARDTAKALPLLQWINDGMRGGPANVARYLGRPLTQMPGDGSEGWAFKGGGLVGFLKDVWGAIADPKSLIEKPINDALASIPGSGAVRDLLVGMGKKLITGVEHFFTGGSSGAGAGTVAAAQEFVKAQAGKPYIWALAGPQGYDCSGIVDAVYNILKGGKGPGIYVHRFSTETAQDYFPKPGFAGPLVAAWSHPGQAPASNSVGHMMGMIGGLTFESTGDRGVHIGSSTRRPTDFANIGHFDRGGVVRLAQIARADFGSAVLERGVNMIYNGTGQREPLVSPGGDPKRLHPDDIAALAQAIGGVIGASLRSTTQLTRTAARQQGGRR
jgi:tape measure domain-containing protein